ncbi:MAG: PQQ-like beta-propeller repeat protein [Planctomycetota bacterium]|nr:PQQ-like beta-propeller repeat protein [Planctomycetota bacterium]
MRGVAAIGVLVWLATVPAWAQTDSGDVGNWPRWRGPLATGVAPQGNPPIEFGEDKNLKWKVGIPGKGSASPIIWGDKLFLLTAIETDNAAADSGAPSATEPVIFQPERRRPGGEGQRGERRGGGGARGGPAKPLEFVVMCLDRNTGKTVWKQTARKEQPHEGTHETNTYASASPVTDGEFLYCSFGSRGVHCYDLDGEKIWEEDLGDMQTKNQFGEGATPALFEDTLVVPWDHDGQSFVVALDTKTGDEKWRVDRDETTTWATPLIVPRGDGHQVVLNGSNRVRSYDLASGKLLWECGGQAQNPIPTPVANETTVYVMTGFRGYALYAVPLDATGDLTESDKIAWKRNDGTPYIASPVLLDGRLYITKGRDAILTCLDAATGDERYANERMNDLRTLYASPVAAAGRLYYFDREGNSLVVKAGDTFEVVVTNKLDEIVDASPAIVGDVMYVRGDKSLYCFAKQ